MSDLRHPLLLIVAGVINLESFGIEASDSGPRHDKPYHEA
jgi:hypothetical protein